MKCPNCGSEIEYGSNFCGLCGCKVEGEPENNQKPYNKKLILILVTIAAVLVIIAAGLAVSTFLNNDEPDQTTYTSTVNTVNTEEQEDTRSTEEETPAEYRADDFGDKSLSEVADIMGGDFEVEYGGDKLVYYTSPTVIMYNDETLPGFAFYIDEAVADYEKGADVKENIKKGVYENYTFLALLDNAKLNDNINAGMRYNDLTPALGEFDCGEIAGAGNYSYSTDTDGKQTIYMFEADDLLDSYRGGAIKKEWLKENNPKLSAIIVFPKASDNVHQSSEKSDAASGNSDSENIKTIKSGAELTLTGTLTSEDYEINSNNKGTVAILNLDAPFKCHIYDEWMSTHGFDDYDGKTEFNIDSVQLNMSNYQNYIGQNITVTGSVFFRHTAHHRRTIILEDCKNIYAVNEGGAANDNSWKQLYVCFINETDNTSRSSYEYNLIYLNNDDIPELCLTGNYVLAGDRFCWIDNGAVQEWNGASTRSTLSAWGTSYIAMGGLLLNSGGRQGFYHDNVFGFDGKNFKQIINGTFNEIYDDNGQFTYEYAYYINGEEVTREKYKETIDAAFDEAKSVYVSERTYSKDEIIEILKNM